MAEYATRHHLAGALAADAARRGRRMNRQQFIVGILAAGCLIATLVLMPGVGRAEMDRVRTLMAVLIEKTGKLGKPHIKGAYPVGGRSAPGLNFGRTRMNNFFGVVDEVAKEQGGVVVLFVKTGDAYVRVATNMKNSDGSRAIGTILDPNSPAIAMIRKGEPYYGGATILGKPFLIGCEPIRDAAGNVIGIYFVGSVQ
jgi:hypothetical protein